jgi:hypothetical protein
MSRSTGGVVGNNRFSPHPMKAGSYTKSQIVVWDATNDYYEAGTTPTPNALVVPYAQTIATDGDMGQLCEAGFFFALSTAVMEVGWPVIPSATAGKVDPAADESYSTPPTAAEINASRAKDRCIFAISREIVDGTTDYYLFEFI